MSTVCRRAIALSAAVIFLLLSIWVLGHRQLGGFDMSALVDTGWRIASGQKPYLDFPLTTPVSFYIGAALAIKLWGANWSAFVLAAMGMAVLAFLAQFYMLMRIISWKYSLAIALVCQMLCHVVISYWWYNSVTVSAACLFLTAAYVFACQPTSRSSVFALWASLTFLSTTKPNIAGITVVLILIVLLLFSPYRLRVILVYLAGLITFFLLLFVLKINPTDVLRGYLEMARGRGLPSINWFFNDKPYEHLVTIPLLFLSVLPLITRISQLKSVYQAINGLKLNFAITVLALSIGVFSMFTNSDSNLAVGVPFFVLGSFVFSLLLPSDSELGVPSKLLLVTVLTCLLLIVFGCIIIDLNVLQNFENIWYAGMIAIGIFTLLMLFPVFSSRQFSQLPQFAKWSFNKLMWVALLACGIVALYAGAMRWRVRYIGPESFYTRLPLVEIRAVPFFENFWVSPRAEAVVAETKTFLTRKFGDPENWQHASIYFGPRIEFSYAAFGVASPKDLPIWWHPDNSYSDIYTKKFIKSFFSHKFKICIFLRNAAGEPDIGVQPVQIVQRLFTIYERDDYTNIIVFYRKNSQ